MSIRYLEIINSGTGLSEIHLQIFHQVWETFEVFFRAASVGEAGISFHKVKGFRV